MKSFTTAAAVHALALLPLAIALVACSPQHNSNEADVSEASIMPTESVAVSSAETMTTDAAVYVGQWTGVEGTRLTITPMGEDYEVVIQDLDGPRTFTGSLKDDGIHIVRDAVPLVIHKGDGQATGMKWLAEKKTCLVVADNEGYCKD